MLIKTPKAVFLSAFQIVNTHALDINVYNFLTVLKQLRGNF
jgi:hypothetical protein